MILVIFQSVGHGLRKMAIASSPRILLESIILWLPYEEQLSGAVVSNLNSSPFPEMFKEPLYSWVLHSSL